MNSLASPIMHVFFEGGKEKCPLGKLIARDQTIYFEYHPDFLKTPMALSPFKLPVMSGVFACEDTVFKGLFGLFYDSLPDGWGRLLLNHQWIRMELDPNQASPLDRLYYVGAQGPGALSYEPAVQMTLPHNKNDLDAIAVQVRAFQSQEGAYVLEDLLVLNGALGGARPKISVTLGGEPWIIKFRSSSDPIDMGAIEYAYHRMAKAARLEVPEAKLFPSQIAKEIGYFGVKRFDRMGSRRIHVHTLSGLLHVDHRIPLLDYEMIMRTTWKLTQDMGECQKQFRACVFNVLSHNRDDHAKNFSFVMNKEGGWKVSPAYDLTFASGPQGLHCTKIMGESANPTLRHLLKLARMSGIVEKNALQIIGEVKKAVAQWPVIAESVGVGAHSLKVIRRGLEWVGQYF